VTVIVTHRRRACEQTLSKAAYQLASLALTCAETIVSALVYRALWPRVRSLVPNTRPDWADGNNVLDRAR
jgi:hypothetical protein